MNRYIYPIFERPPTKFLTFREGERVRLRQGVSAEKWPAETRLFANRIGIIEKIWRDQRQGDVALVAWTSPTGEPMALNFVFSIIEKVHE